MSVKLIVEKPEQSEPVVPIRWCVDKKTLDILKENGVPNPFLLFSVQHEDEKGNKREVDRVLVPLEQGMEYIHLRHAGKHNIKVLIIYHYSDKTKRLREGILSEYRSGSYQNNFYNKSAEFQSGFVCNISGCQIIASSESSITIQVGKEFFAPEPAPWVKRWANLWFKYAPRDQCEFRKRKILAFSVQPFAMALWLPFNTVVRFLSALLFNMIGVMDISFAPVLHPFKNDIDDVWPREGHLFNKQTNFFFTRANGARRSRFFLFLNPFVFAALAYSTYRANQRHLFSTVSHFHVWKWVAVEVVVTAVLWWFFTSGLNKLIPALEKSKYTRDMKRAEKKDQESAAQAEKDRQALVQKYEQGVQHIVCDGGALSLKVAALPKPRQTFHLRFEEFKFRVCKTFAES